MWNGFVRFVLVMTLVSAAGMVVFWAAFLWNHVKKEDSVLVAFNVKSVCDQLPEGAVFEPQLTVQRRLEVIVRAEIAHSCDVRLEGTVEERNGEIVLIATDSSEHQPGSTVSPACKCEKTLVYRLKAARIKRPASFVLMIGDKVSGRVKES